MALAEGHKHTMALDQSALLEVLDALKAAEVDDRIRQAAETIYQALIEAEPVAAGVKRLDHRWTAAGQRVAPTQPFSEMSKMTPSGSRYLRSKYSEPRSTGRSMWNVPPRDSIAAACSSRLSHQNPMWWTPM
jgi:hypothetical protein